MHAKSLLVGCALLAANAILLSGARAQTVDDIGSKQRLEEDMRRDAIRIRINSHPHRDLLIYSEWLFNRGPLLRDGPVHVFSLNFAQLTSRVVLDLIETETLPGTLEVKRWLLERKAEELERLIKARTERGWQGIIEKWDREGLENTKRQLEDVERRINSARQKPLPPPPTPRKGTGRQAPETSHVSWTPHLGVLRLRLIRRGLFRDDFPFPPNSGTYLH
jgi:hypothetical protein